MIRTYRISDTVIPSKLNAARGRLKPKIGRFKNEASKQAYESSYRELESTWPVASTKLVVPTSFGTTNVRRSGTGTETPNVSVHSLGGHWLQWNRDIEEQHRKSKRLNNI